MNKANNVISLIDIKKALRDSVFRDSLPQDLKEDIKKFLENPSCACNVPIYHKVMKYGGEALRKYYPDKNLVSPEEEAVQLARNNWSVFNCSIGELELKLKNIDQLKICEIIYKNSEFVNDYIKECKWNIKNSLAN